MKKLVTIFMLGALVMYSMGYIVVYQHNMRIIKRQMRAAIHKGDFDPKQQVQFQFDFFDPSCFKGVEVKDKGKEIKYKGEMFDILTVQVQGNKLIVNCLADKDESKLVAGFAKTMEENGPGLTNKKSIKFIKFSFPLFTLPELVVEDQNNSDELLVQHNTYYPLITLQHYLNIPSPPPWQS